MHQLTGRDAEFGETGGVVLDEDPFFLSAVDLDLRDLLDAKQFVAHLVGDLLRLGVGVALGRHREHDAEDVAELVVDERTDRVPG